MFVVGEVVRVGWSAFNKCTAIRYLDGDTEKSAACVEDIDVLDVKPGDKVEIYTDDKLNYCGLGALALRVIK